MTPIDFVKTWFSNIDNKQFDANKALMAPNHQFHNPMMPVPADAEGHLGMMQMMTSAFEGTHNIDFCVVDGNRVAVRGFWEGKHTGEFEGIPATGNSVRFSFADFFQIENGQLTNEYLEMNPMAIMQQIGAVPA